MIMVNILIKNNDIYSVLLKRNLQITCGNYMNKYFVIEQVTNCIGIHSDEENVPLG